MRKKMILSLCFCLCVISLSGCTKSRELTDDEQNLVAEYVAGRLQQNDSEYEWKLVETSPAPAPQATVQAAHTAQLVQTEAPVSEQAVSQTDGEEKKETLKEISLNELFHVNNMSVSYKSYKVTKEYATKSSVSELTANKGEKLFVAAFSIHNASSKALKVNLIKRKISYNMDLDGVSYEPSIALLDNGGLNCLNTKLKSNSSEQAVLVYNIPEQSANAKSIVITARDGDNISTIKLK